MSIFNLFFDELVEVGDSGEFGDLVREAKSEILGFVSLWAAELVREERYVKKRGLRHEALSLLGKMKGAGMDLGGEGDLATMVGKYRDYAKTGNKEKEICESVAEYMEEEKMEPVSKSERPEILGSENGESVKWAKSEKSMTKESKEKQDDELPEPTEEKGVKKSKSDEKLGFWGSLCRCFKTKRTNSEII